MNLSTIIIYLHVLVPIHSNLLNIWIIIIIIVK